MVAYSRTAATILLLCLFAVLKFVKGWKLAMKLSKLYLC